jgi:hypothetical protein
MGIETAIPLEVWTEEHVPPPFVNFYDAGSERKHKGDEYCYLDYHLPASNVDQLFDPRNTMVNSIPLTSSESKPNALRSGKSLETGGSVD